MKIGSVEILPILDGAIVSKLPATKRLPDPESILWHQQHGMFRTDGMIEMVDQVLLPSLQGYNR